MGFIQLHQEEILKLMELKRSGVAWGVYCSIRAHAWVNKKNHDASYWAFPGQESIGDYIGLKSKNDRKTIYESTRKLVEIGLIRIHRPLWIIERDRTTAKSKADKIRYSEERQISSQVRDQLKEWQKQCGARVIIYELVYLRELNKKHGGYSPHDTGATALINTGVTAPTKNKKNKHNTSIIMNTNENETGGPQPPLSISSSYSIDNIENIEDRMILINGSLLTTNEAMILTRKKPGDLKLVKEMEDLQYMESMTQDRIHKTFIAAEISNRQNIEENFENWKKQEISDNQDSFVEELMEALEPDSESD